MRFPILTVFLICIAHSAFADGTINKIITASDKVRLASHETTKAQALSEARKGGDTGRYTQTQRYFCRTHSRIW